ncbi:actin-histidine N-methyltransferase [Scaptodrosophila lebanonensis]|uniref:protein-histidine N-methyltransferase n=1 Tax=Drosophila lebanonensis TaxID=7225 RepID=A0A6J2TTK6_DROLE|nr:actin-histidine N-methyltransferase [Scaptodrosophila lebanonensis]
MGKNKRNNKQQHKNKQQAATLPSASATETTTTTAKGKHATGNHNNHHQQQNSSVNNNINGTRFPTFNTKQRNELNALVLRLLELAHAVPSNANEEWKQYVDMQQLLQRIMAIEEPLQRHICMDASNANEKMRLAKVAAFSDWAKAGGIQTDCVEIAVFPGYQLGLRAKRDIAANEQVLTVPRKLIFSEEHLPESDRKLFSNFPLLTNFNLAYALVIEKVRGTQSSWHPYIEVLPARYNTVLYFSVEQMQRLRGTSACTAALRQCRVIARQYASMYKCAHIRNDSSVMASMGVLFTQHGLCYELYRWAVSTVMTRQNLVPREYFPPEANADDLKDSPISALIPFWDMANHKPGKITSFYGSAAQQMECAAQEAYKAGEQFFIYYGDRCNADMLVHNGFLDPDNRKDYVNIKLGLSPTDPLAEQRASLLARLNIERKAELRVLPAPDYISGELLAFVRVFNMSAAQLEHWHSDPERTVDLLHIDCALETDHETRTWQYLYQRLKLLLGVFEATQGALEASLPDGGAAEKLQALQVECNEQVEGGGLPQRTELEIDLMLLQYRRLEKQILAEALQYAQERCKV